jgi:lipopolysaccharide transport system ATP-binding protein
MEFEISLPSPRLAPGNYCCGVSVGKGDHRSGMVDFDTILDVMPFEVRAEEGDGGTVAEWNRGWGPVVLPELKYRPASPPSSFEIVKDDQEMLSG